MFSSGSQYLKHTSKNFNTIYQLLFILDASIKEPDDSQAQGAYSKRLHDRNILQLCISQVPATAIRCNIRNQLEDRK
jgi:hypothetical protein